MNVIDILRHGHETVKTAVNQLPQNEWHIPGVCGHWSVKDIVAHLTSFEQLLIEVAMSLQPENVPTPVLDHLLADEAQFNDSEVEKRQEQTVEAIWAEYETAYKTAVDLLNQIPAEQFRQKGLLSWYGETYDLEDFLVYTYYGHKREHCAQVSLFRDRIASRGKLVI